jgi:hypothetical protein
MASGNGSSTSHATGERLDEITATRIIVDRSAVRSLDATEADVERAAVQRLRAGNATITQSAIAFASMEQGTLRQSTAGAVIARSVACDEVRTGVLISPVVRGDVHTWLDMRSAVAIGVGMVLGKTLLAGARSLAQRATS